ncbi:MAG: hypothetical protein ACRDQ0_21890, partial [Pseudonocardia sp.]
MTAIPPAVPSTEGALAGPVAGPRKRRFGKASFDSVSFFVVFLGIPLALFLIFVIWPFVQACFYALTD